MKYNIGDTVIVYNIDDREYQYGIILEARKYSIPSLQETKDKEILYKILNQKYPNKQLFYSQWHVYPIELYNELVETHGIMNPG